MKKKKKIKENISLFLLYAALKRWLLSFYPHFSQYKRTSSWYYQIYKLGNHEWKLHHNVVHQQFYNLDKVDSNHKEFSNPWIDYLEKIKFQQTTKNYANLFSGSILSLILARSSSVNLLHFSSRILMHTERGWHNFTKSMSNIMLFLRTSSTLKKNAEVY